MSKLVSEGVRLPDDLDAYPDQNFPASLLVPFLGKWQLHHLALDNHMAFVEAAKKAGIGIVPIPGAASAYRPYAQQKALFESRYTTQRVSTSKKVWQGRTYYLKPGMAMAAVPGSSGHGWGMAVDYMRDNGRAITAAERIKLRPLGAPFSIVDSVKSEPWHWTCQNAQQVAGHPVTAPSLPVSNDAALLQEAAGMPRLRPGDNSMHVALLQNILREQIHQAEVQSTGVFDEVTRQGLVNFQNWYKLTPTGVVDAGDWFWLLKVERGLA